MTWEREGEREKRAMYCKYGDNKWIEYVGRGFATPPIGKKDDSKRRSLDFGLSVRTVAQ